MEHNNSIMNIRFPRLKSFALYYNFIHRVRAAHSISHTKQAYLNAREIVIETFNNS